MSVNIVQKKGTINSYGGLNFIKNFADHKKLSSLINRQLGNRAKQSKYAYSDVLLSWIYCTMSGAKRIEDSMHLKSSLEGIPGLLVPSSDRIAQLMKKLSPEPTLEESDKQTYQFANNDVLNDLNIKICKKLGLFSKGMLDFDATSVYTEKADCKKIFNPITKTAYQSGYSPAVSFLDGHPVYVQMRDGNSSAAFKIKDAIKNSIDLLRKNNVDVKMLRSDAAAYNKELFNYLNEQEGIQFIIRAKNVPEFADDYQYSKFKPEVICGLDVELLSVKYTPYRTKTEHRVVLMKCHQRTGDITHRAIITNNWDMSDKEVVECYNARGDIERNFDDLKNNFNVGRLPFSYIHFNNTFTIISCIAFNIYKYCIRKLSKTVKRLQPNFRIKKFIQLFINVISKWEDGQLILYTEIPYPPLI